MPRISPRTLRKALSINPHLARLLPVCRDLRSAQNELRWLSERADELKAQKQQSDVVVVGPTGLSRLVALRAKGTPLQYILGSEWFGDLEIKCKPGVLIPRLVSYLLVLISFRRSFLIRFSFPSGKKQLLQSNISLVVSYRDSEGILPHPLPISVFSTYAQALAAYLSSFTTNCTRTHDVPTSTSM